MQVSQRAIVQNFFQRKLHATLPLDADFFEEKQFSFQGNAQQLQFVAAMPASVGKLGIQLFTLSLQPGENDQGAELKVNIRPFFPKSESEEWDDESVVILKHIQELRFSYFGADEEVSDESAWQDEWLDKQVLPKMVSVDIELTNGEVWPQVVTALRIESAGKNGAGGQRSPFDIMDGKFTPQ